MEMGRAVVRRCRPPPSFSARKRDAWAHRLNLPSCFALENHWKVKSNTAEIARRTAAEFAKEQQVRSSQRSLRKFSAYSAVKSFAAGVSLFLFGPTLQTRQPAAHVSTIRLVLGAKFPAERGLFVEDYEQVDAESNRRG